MMDRLKTFASTAGERINRFIERFSALSTREKRIFAVACIAVSATLVYYGIVQPIHKSLEEMRKKIFTQERVAIANMRDVTQKLQMDPVYRQLLDSIGLRVSGDSDELRSTVLQDLEQFARSRGISLTEVKPQAPVERGNFKDFFVRAQAEGNMEQLLNFLADLIEARKMYFIESIKITPHGDDVNKIKVNVSIGRAVILNT